MKKILLFFILLTTISVGFARNVQIHLTDLRGKAMPDMTIVFLGDYMTTNADGNFTITGLTSGGTYSFQYYGNGTSGTTSFEWDGGSPTVNVKLPICKITLVLTGLSEEEMAMYGDHDIALANGSPNNYGRTYYFDNGELTLVWQDSTLQWTFSDTYLGGITKSEVIDLTTTTESIQVNPLKGKHLVTFGNVIGHDGKPLTDYRINNIPSSEFPNGVLSWWRAPGQDFYTFSAKDYYGYQGKYTVNDENITVDIDLSTCVGVTVQAKDRDGSPLADAYILTTYQRDTLGITDHKGEYTFYISPKNYINISLATDKPMYPMQYEEFRIGSEDKTITMGYEGYHLISTRIIGGARFIAPYESWSNEIMWSQNAIVCLRSIDDEDGEYNSSIESYLSYEKQGNDIIVGTLIDNRENYWQEACLELSFQNTTPCVLPVTGTYVPLTGDIYTEYDVTNHVPVTLTAPEGFRFNQNIKVDEQIIGVEWGNQQALPLYVPQGEHNWAPQLIDQTDYTPYPYGKPQTFTVGKDSTAVVYPFDINNYSTIHFTVLNKDGKPFQNMDLSVYDQSTLSYNNLIVRTSTNAEGQVTVFLSGPGTYSWITDPSNEYGFSQKGETEVGEGPANVTISYEDWHTLTLSLTGKNIEERFNSARCRLSYSGYEISLASYNNYTDSRLIPSGTISSSIELTGKNNISGSFPFKLEAIDSDVTYTLNTDSIHSVYFTLNGEPISYKEGNVRVYHQNRNISYRVYSSGVLLASGSYYAVFETEKYNYQDTLYFDVVDEDLTVDFKLNPDDFHSVTFKFINAPTEILEANYMMNGSYSSESYPNGTYHYEINWLYDAHEDNIRTCIRGTVEIKDEDVEVIIDLSNYRFFEITLRKEDGTPLDIDEDEDSYMIVETADGTRMILWPEDDFAIIIPVGHYGVTVRDYDNNCYYYGKLYVPSDCPEKIVLTLSTNADGIEDTTDATNTLAATPTANGLHITASGNEPVTVSLYSTDGHLQLNRQVTPGTTVSTTHLGKGIYIVQLKQGNNLRTQKLLR